MQKPTYWNHNTAYYDWIFRETASCRSILDVGCGDGTLCAYLDDGIRSVTGIDPDAGCIRAAETRRCENADFLCGDFMAHPFACSFDAVVFVASLHHMEMQAAIRKAKISSIRVGNCWWWVWRSRRAFWTTRSKRCAFSPAP